MRLTSRNLWKTLRRPEAVAALGVALLAAGVVSCASVKRVVVAPPSIPGASFVGSQACADCHEELTRDFRSAFHANLVVKGTNAVNIGCESCHGPGSVHSEAGGGRANILNPGKSPETCFQCHLDKRAEFNLPHRHPLLEGKMACNDCHDSHKGPAVRGGGTALLSENEGCLACHGAQRGPHAFEHEALREGCTTCHKAHGSINAKLLTERNANLCLKCHFQQQVAGGQILIGGLNHTPFLSRGTCWSAGCHEAVHGSQVNSSLRF